MTEDVVDPTTFKQARAAFTDEFGRDLTSDEDIAKLKRVEKYSVIYLV